jgi:hypothetical protein
MGRCLLTAVVIALLAGCAGESGPERAFTGGTYEKRLGIALVIDRVEVDSSEAQAFIRVRNPSARKLLFDPSAAKILVDEEEYPSEGSRDYIGLVVDVGVGGGESSGILVFPGVPTDGNEYSLHLEAESTNPTIGDSGRLTWDVALG